MGVSNDTIQQNLEGEGIRVVEQRKYFTSELRFLEGKGNSIINKPETLNTFNLYKSEEGLLKMKAKFKNEVFHRVFLPRESKLTELLIRETHDKMGHSGIYSVLRELKRQFWVPRFFSVVKKILNSCIICKRFNSRPIRLNQNSYREFRCNPSKRPFSNIFVDYIGPFFVKNEGIRRKVWIFALTCLYTRAINLFVCRSLNTDDFLRVGGFSTNSHI